MFNSLKLLEMKTLKYIFASAFGSILFFFLSAAMSMPAAAQSYNNFDNDYYDDNQY